MAADNAFATLAAKFPEVAGWSKRRREHGGILWLTVDVKKPERPGSETPDPVLLSNVAISSRPKAGSAASSRGPVSALSCVSGLCVLDEVSGNVARR